MNHYHSNSTQSNCEEIIDGCCSSSSSMGSPSSSLASSPQQTQTLQCKMTTSSSISTKPIYINSYSSSTNSTESSPVPYSTSLSSYKNEHDYDNDEMMNQQQNDDEYLDSSSMSDDMMLMNDNQVDQTNNGLNGSINNNGANGRTNRFFPDAVVDILNKWFYENQDYPYPDENMTNVLAKDANISAKQVRKWFANKRVRSNKCYKQTSKTSKRDNIKSRRQTKSISDVDMINYNYGMNQLNYTNTNNYNSSISSDNESLYHYDTSCFNQSKSAIQNKKMAYIKPKPSTSSTSSTSNSTSSSFNSSSLLNDSSNYHSGSYLHRSTSAYTTQEFMYNLNMWKNAMENGQQQFLKNNRNDDQSNTQFNLDLNNHSINNDNTNLKCSTTLLVTNHYQTNNTNTNSKLSKETSSINNTAAVVAAALSNPILLVNLLQQQQSQQQNLASLLNNHKENINNTSTDNSYNETDSTHMLNSSVSSNGSPSSSSIIKRKTQLSNCYMKESTDQPIKRSNSFIGSNTPILTAAVNASTLLEKYITNASSPIKPSINLQNIYSSPIQQHNSNHMLLNTYQQYYYQMQQQMQQNQQQHQLQEPKRKTKINFGDVSDLVN